MSQKESMAIDEIIASLKAEYRKVGEVTICRGKVHEYLGMTLDFSKLGKFIINMENYMDEDMNGTSSSLAAEHLYKIRDSTVRLRAKQA
jgi:hypothetical protein